MLLPLLFAAVAGQATPGPAALGVEDVARDLRAHHGHVVMVRGRVSPGCGPRSCALIGERDEQARLSIARVDAVEAELVGHAGHVVTLEARVDASCGWRPPAGGDVIVCTDRAPQLTPLRILPAPPRAHSH